MMEEERSFAAEEVSEGVHKWNNLVFLITGKKLRLWPAG